VEKWNSVCYTGQPKAVAEATAAISGEFSVLYMLSTTEGWIRYVPGNPDSAKSPSCKRTLLWFCW